jgi:hypothetical protein
MADPVELPIPGPGASPIEIFKVIANRMDTVARVLESEHKWLGRVVEISRSLDDTEAQIAKQIADGWLDEEEAEHKRAHDDLEIPKANVDKHQHNIDSAVHILRDASRSLLALIGDDDGGASCD